MRVEYSRVEALPDTKYLGTLQGLLAVRAYHVAHEEKRINEEEPQSNVKEVKDAAMELWLQKYTGVFNDFVEESPRELPSDLGDHHAISILFDKLRARRNALTDPSIDDLDKNLSF